MCLILLFTHFRAEYWDNSLFTGEWLQTLINWFQLNWKCKDCNNLFCAGVMSWGEWGFLILYLYIFCWCADIYFTRWLLKLAHHFCRRFCKCRNSEMIIFVKPPLWQVRQTLQYGKWLNANRKFILRRIHLVILLLVKLWLDVYLLFHSVINMENDIPRQIEYTSSFCKRELLPRFISPMIKFHKI